MAKAFLGTTSGDKIAYYTDASGNLKQVGVANSGLDLSGLQTVELGNTPEFQAATMSGVYNPYKGGLPSGSIEELKGILGAGAVAPTDLKPIDQRGLPMGGNIPTKELTDWVNQNSGAGATKLTPGGSPLYQSGAVQKWLDQGQPSPAGVGMPAPNPNVPPAGATYISSPAELKGLTEADIWRDSASNKIYKLQKATLTSPTGVKKVVTVGSTEASGLLKSGWTLGDQVGGGTVTSKLLTPEPEINIGTGTTTNNSQIADSAKGGMEETSKSADEAIKKNYEMLKGEETPKEKDLESLYSLLGTEAQNLTGRGAMQLTEEQKRGIETKTQALASENTKLKQKLAEDKALTASYQLKNQQEEGSPQTLSRLQGAQAQNYKMYLAQHNSLIAEAGYIQANILGLQGEIEAAQNAANRAVDLEYTDRESAYNATLAKINILLPQITGEDEKYAKAVELYLTQQKEALAQQKQDKKDIIAVKLEAIKSGISDSSILSQIGNAKTVDEALQIYGKNKPKDGAKWGEIGTDMFGNKQYGWINEKTQQVTPANNNANTSSGVVTDASGSSYDITDYATDPNHEAKVQKILNNMGQMTSVGQMDAYIQKFAPGSPITGQMISNASQKYGVSWESIMAIIQQDSSFGTAGAGARSFNPGNVGNTETATSTGNLVNMGNWQSGVDVVGNWLASHKTTSQPGQDNNDLSSNTTIQAWARDFASSGTMPSGVPKNLMGAVADTARTMPKYNGMIIDKSTLVAPGKDQITSGNKDGLLALYDIQKKIEQAKDLYGQIAWNGFIPSIWGAVKPTADQQRYMDLRAEITDLIARARTGAVINTSEERLYNSKLPSLFTGAFFFGKNGNLLLEDFRNSIGGLVESKLEGFGLDIIGREKVVDGKTLVRAYENGVLGWKEK